ncbi:hypothetical protein [Dactylosporangium sp. NPDC048998]|uniref:hypothetical protein n=1 Tax=Dactylosporangium sp. NPDC048998 TaxID=3363976 RepID=UPI0037122020
MSIDPMVSAVQARGSERIHALRTTARRGARGTAPASTSAAVSPERMRTRNVVRTGALVSVVAAGAGLIVASGVLRLIGVRSGMLAVVLLILGTTALAAATGLAAGHTLSRRDAARSSIIE